MPACEQRWRTLGGPAASGRAIGPADLAVRLDQVEVAAGAWRCGLFGSHGRGRFGGGRVGPGGPGRTSTACRRCTGPFGGGHVGCRSVVGGANLGDLGLRVAEPVGGPEPVETPAETLQVLAAQPVAVANATRRTVRSAVCLDGQNHPVGLV